MTPEQALQNLDAIVATVQLTRSQHVVLQESVRVLSEFITAHQARAGANGQHRIIQMVEDGSSD
ncbi:MAG: hypothetical protein HUU16_00130 [Candidatus Omnitrophica bacterium]|nr:hypothetical protein [Candidatus Omnitrophota bacterium]